MLSTKKLLYKIVSAIRGDKTWLASSNWTAIKATFVEGYTASCGAVRAMYITVKATQAMTAGTEYKLGTISGIDLTAQGSAVGVTPQGTVSLVGGEVRLYCLSAVQSGGNLYVRIIWLGV